MLHLKRTLLNCSNNTINVTVLNICGTYGIQKYFKGNRTLKNILVKPKDQGTNYEKMKDNILVKCSRLDYDEEYVGGSARTFGESFKEHLKAPSPIYGQNTTLDNFNIVDGGHDFTTKIKKSIL